MGQSIDTTVSVVGAIAVMGGIEHGLGEILQGSIAPAAIVFPSWGSAPFFAVLGGEPAMSLIPNLLLSGVLTVIVSLAYLAWSTVWLRRRRSALVLLALCVLLLLVGGGFGPPLIGTGAAIAAFKVNSRLTWWRTRAPTGLRRGLAAAWPWFLGVEVTAWLVLFPGVAVADYAFGLDGENSAFALLMLAGVLLGLLMLLLAATASLARDARGRSGAEAVAPA